MCPWNWCCIIQHDYRLQLETRACLKPVQNGQLRRRFWLADHICKCWWLTTNKSTIANALWLCSLGNCQKGNSNFKSHFLCFKQRYLRCFLLRILGASWLQAPMPTKFTKEPVPIQSENIARVANAVQVTLWVLVTNLNVMIFVPQFVTNGQLCHFTLSH